MNKKEIDNLEDYLKNKLPKIEPTIPITNFGSVDLEDLMDNIRQLKKVPTSDELLRENKRLRSQLEEKDKVIDEAINYINKHRAGFIQPIKYIELSEILERGKNGK